MNPKRIFPFSLLIGLCSLFVLCYSCKKKEAQNEPAYLTVSIAGLELQYGLYYSLGFQER